LGDALSERGRDRVSPESLDLEFLAMRLLRWCRMPEMSFRKCCCPMKIEFRLFLAGKSLASGATAWQLVLFKNNFLYLTDHVLKRLDRFTDV
jgi:hypothetical protein